jgi:DNA-binding CsgD family transcriptional regulator/PAS domain-containing protein
MNILSFFATFALAVTLIEGLYILSRDYRSVSNQLFSLICISISIWLVGGAFGYSSTDRDDTFLWLKVTSLGFIFLHAFVLHFTIRYTKTTKSNWIYLLYLPSFIFVYISLTDHLVFSDIYQLGDYWVMVPDYQSTAFYLFMANYLTFYLISLALLYRAIKKTGSNRIRSQSRIIFIAIIITIASYNIEPFLVPLFFNYHTYGQAPLYSLIWISLIWYAMRKYRFLGIYEDFLLFDVLDSMSEMVVITDEKQRVFNLNKALREKLGSPPEITSLKDIFVEHELLHRLLNSRGKNFSDIILNLAVPEGATGLVKARSSAFHDRFGDSVGFIITAEEITKSSSLLQEKGITEREYQLIELILAGNTNRHIARTLGISLRTVETHVTNIFNKLGVNKRSELVNYCGEFFAR